VKKRLENPDTKGQRVGGLKKLGGGLRKEVEMLRRMDGVGETHEIHPEGEFEKKGRGLRGEGGKSKARGRDLTKGPKGD